MLSLLTVSIPSETYDLTLLATVKAELNLTDATYDDLLNVYIHQVSDAIMSHCNRVFAVETLRETPKNSAAGSGIG